jgi:hypothetical protein
VFVIVDSLCAATRGLDENASEICQPIDLMNRCGVVRGGRRVRSALYDAGGKQSRRWTPPRHECQATRSCGAHESRESSAVRGLLVARR